MEKPCFHFLIDESLQEGVRRLSRVLGFTVGEGITVEAREGDYTGVMLMGNRAVITYAKKHLFFRMLGILVEKCGKGDFEVL